MWNIYSTSSHLSLLSRVNLNLVNIAAVVLREGCMCSCCWTTTLVMEPASCSSVCLKPWRWDGYLVGASDPILIRVINVVPL